MKFISGISILILTLLLSSCRTGGVILRETPLNVSETRRAIVSVIGEPKSVSQNGRELVSQYYDKKNKAIEKMDKAKERLYTQVTVLGDRRPYDIQVEVFIEAADGQGGFESLGRDDDRAAVLAEKIRQALNLSRDTRNIIDDFRSF